MPELKEFDELVADIRATAPEPREHFIARLDKRVEAGFPKQRPQRKAGWLWRPTLALTTCVVLALVVVVTSMNNSGDHSGEAVDTLGGGGASSAEVAPPPAEDDQAQALKSGEADGSAAPFANEIRPTTRSASPPTAPGNRRVVERRTTLELLASRDEFADVSDGVLRVADDTGSIVQRSSVNERDGRGRATFDLRVPSSRLDDALADLSRLAHVTSRTASSDDITLPYVSARDRLQDARDERAALLRALGRADTDVEADALRRRIRDARTRIARAERDVRRLRSRADRARVLVTVESSGRSSDGGAWTPGDALDDAGRVLEVAAGVAVVAGAVLLPIAILFGLAAAAARVVRRRRRDAALG